MSENIKAAILMYTYILTRVNKTDTSDQWRILSLFWSYALLKIVLIEVGVRGPHPANFEYVSQICAILGYFSLHFDAKISDTKTCSF